MTAVSKATAVTDGSWIQDSAPSVTGSDVRRLCYSRREVEAHQVNVVQQRTLYATLQQIRREGVLALKSYHEERRIVRRRFQRLLYTASRRPSVSAQVSRATARATIMYDGAYSIRPATGKQWSTGNYPISVSALPFPGTHDPTSETVKTSSSDVPVEDEDYVISVRSLFEGKDSDVRPRHRTDTGRVCNRPSSLSHRNTKARRCHGNTTVDAAARRPTGSLASRTNLVQSAPCFRKKGANQSTYITSGLTYRKSDPRSLIQTGHTKSLSPGCTVCPDTLLQDVSDRLLSRRIQRFLDDQEKFNGHHPIPAGVQEHTEQGHHTYSRSNSVQQPQND